MLIVDFTCRAYGALDRNGSLGHYIRRGSLLSFDRTLRKLAFRLIIQRVLIVQRLIIGMVVVLLPLLVEEHAVEWLRFLRWLRGSERLPVL